jgi:hypothetical protein
VQLGTNGAQSNLLWKLLKKPQILKFAQCVQIAEWNQIDSKGIQYKTFACQSKVRIGLFPTIGNDTKILGATTLQDCVTTSCV